MFKFKAYNDAELEKLKNDELLPENEYSFEVLEIAEKISRNGNEMIVVKLKIQNRTMPDWIVMTNKMAYKFKHFCASVGLAAAYEKEEIDLNLFLGRQGKLLLGIKEGASKKDGSGNFRNYVKEYIKFELPAELQDAFGDKDIPF